MKSYFPSLDALRGVAALGVVGSHFANISGIDLHLHSAGVAVDFFFILSGFVIGQAYEGRLRDGLSWASYMRIRLQRLYPAIFAGIVVGLAVSAWAGDALYPGLIAQFLLLPAIGGPAVRGGELFPLNAPQWSLFWELAANGAHALVIRWLTTPVLAVIAALSAAAVIGCSFAYGGLDIGWGRATAIGGLPRVLFGFSTGLLLFRLWRSGWRPPPAPLPMLAALLVAMMIQWTSSPVAWVSAIEVVALAPAIVALALGSAPPRRMEGFAAALGTLSYPIYAIHAPLLRGFETVLTSINDQPPQWQWWLALGATVALAVGFERLYDAPVRAWLRGRAGPTA